MNAALYNVGIFAFPEFLILPRSRGKKISARHYVQKLWWMSNTELITLSIVDGKIFAVHERRNDYLGPLHISFTHANTLLVCVDLVLIN